MVNCAICESLNSPRENEFWNVPLLQTDHFVVIPSLGAMVAGWLLVVPKEHFLCMGAMPDVLEAEYSELSHRVCAHLENLYNEPVVLFEHGPSRMLKRTGCGVDHAHVHFLPFAGDIIHFAAPYLTNSSEWEVATPQGLREAYLAGLDYLYVKIPGQAARMVTSREFSSQVFRHAIADSLQIPDEYQWREFLRLETVANTIGRFRSGQTPIVHGVEHAT